MLIQEVCDWLDRFAPTHLAEDWDNVGLLVGDGAAEVSSIMTCLTVTPESCAEAIKEGAQLIVTHHPMPFRPVKRLTREGTPGSLLLDLIRAGVAIHSPHTAFDSAKAGINQMLAEALGCDAIEPLLPNEDDPTVGSGRVGSFDSPCTLDEVAARLSGHLKIDGMHQVGSSSDSIQRVAFACGSGGSFLSSAANAKCELMVTGETTFHTCLEAQATGMALLLPGHFASERFAVEKLAELLREEFGQLKVWAARDEKDPLVWRS